MEDIFKENNNDIRLLIPIDRRNLFQLSKTLHNVETLSKGIHYLSNNSEFAFNIYGEFDENFDTNFDDPNIPDEFKIEYYRKKLDKHKHRFSYSLYSRPLIRFGDDHNVAIGGFCEIPKKFHSEPFMDSDADEDTSLIITDSDLINTSLEQARYAFVLGRYALLNELGFADTYHMQYSLFSSLSKSLSVFFENISSPNTYFDYKILNANKYFKWEGTLKSYTSKDTYIKCVADKKYHFNAFLVSLFRLFSEVNNAFKHRGYDSFVVTSTYTLFDKYYSNKPIMDDFVELDVKFDVTTDNNDCTCLNCGKHYHKDNMFTSNKDDNCLMYVIISNNVIFKKIGSIDLIRLKDIIAYIEEFRHQFILDLENFNPELRYSIEFIDVLISNTLVYTAYSDEQNNEPTYTVDFVALMRILYAYYLKTLDDYDFIDY